MEIQGKLKILTTADWHIGNFRSPIKDGINLRSEDTKRCLDELIRVAREEQPDYTLISGDIFHVGKLWSDRCCEEIITAIHYIKELAAASGQVIVMRGTPNHDGAGQFNVLSEMFADYQNVHIVTTPQVLDFENVDIAVLPGFDRGVYRAKFPGLSGEAENEAITQELSNIVTGLRAQCAPGKRSVLMAHYTVPGCNTESGQTMMLTQFEPIIPQEALIAAGYDLVALGHIHRPQRILSYNWFYSGAINAMNFNDEGQERGFWIHESLPFDTWNWNSTFYKTPIREFISFNFTDTDITAINLGNIDEVAFNYWRYNGAVQDRIVRIHYSCTEENSKALNRAALERTLLEDGAFMVWEILPDKIDEFANRTELAKATDPEANLIKYLEEKQVPSEKIQELVLKARPIITEAEASMTTGSEVGIFEPVEISVKNYRNYEEETFNFEDITFCTINGQNGAGKSSLFMDAIIDCLYEEPREGVIKDDSGKAPWLRNDEKVRSGSIMFIFRIGEKKYRVTRTRARSGKGTLNISQFIDGDWKDRSKERYNDTQQEILNIIGMDSFTFRSCALIMQDQYGLFLQAKPEERVEVLGTLLGLGIYQSMERIAADKAKTNGAKSRELKQEVEIHNATIREFGNPDEELKECERDLAEQEKRLNEKVSERDQKKLILSNRQAASERRKKALAAISTLSAKKAATEQNRVTQQAIIDSSVAILSGREEIEAKIAERNALLKRELELAGQSALYTSKKQEAENLAKQAESEQKTISELQATVQAKQHEKSLRQEGRLMYRGIVPYTPDMIATITNHQVGTVERAMKIFEQMGFIEILDNGAIYMMDIQNFIGQSSNEADRKRSYRKSIESEKIRLLGDNNGTNDTTNDTTNDGQMSDKNPPEIRDKRLEIKDKENINILAQSSGKQTSEPEADVAALTLNDGTEWRPSEALFAEYVRLYPGVDVKQQFNEMRSWCLSNPNRRKTKRGITRFVNSWLSREQDKGVLLSKPKNFGAPDNKNKFHNFSQRDYGAIYTKSLGIKNE